MKLDILQRAAGALRKAVPAPGELDATALTPARRTAFFLYFDGARARLDGATELHETDNTVPALLLYADGFSMLARAYGAATAEDPSALDAATTLHAYLDYLGQKYERAARVLRENLPAEPKEPAALDALPAAELRARADELSSVTPEIVALLTPRKKDAGRRRMVRATVVIVVLLASAVAIARFLIRPENVALHKLATSATTAFNTKPSGAVNGRIYEQYGFHSDNEASPWLRIDLGKPYDLTRIRVHGRHDCCFDQSIPMAVELSLDGENFTTLAERHEAFDQLDPWDIDPDQPARARYIRVRTLKKGLLVLTEVEAYGKPAP
jgi:hypothetical protein